MTLDPSTFEYLMPTEAQKAMMQRCRNAFALIVSIVEKEMPPGPDRDHVVRQLRDCAMWTNVGITRSPDGSPRE